MHSTFYRDVYEEHGLQDLKVKSEDDIRRIPVIKKSMLRAYAYQDILTVPLSNQLNLHTTSGSSGDPFRVYQTKLEDYLAHVRVFAMLRDMGYHPFRKITMISRFEEKDSFQVERDLGFIHKLRKFLHALEREIISVYTPPLEIVAQIEKDPPYILWSTPSMLDLVALELERQGKSWSIPVVVLTSENILNHQMKRFRKRVGQTILSHYGLMEATTMAYEINDSRRKKLLAYSFLTEYVDQREEDGRKFGTPVVTNLENYTMPFIRYSSEDIGEMIDDPEFPARLMGPIIGRMDDILEFPDGSQFIHHHAHEMFMDFEACEQFKFIQYDCTEIILQLKPAAGQDKEHVKQLAMARWNMRFAQYPLRIEFVDRFEINPVSGKVKNMERIKA